MTYAPHATKTKYDTSKDVQFIIVAALLAGVVLIAVGLGMALIPGGTGYEIDSGTAMGSALLRQENGQMLAVVGTILTVGTGIMLILRSRLARTPGM